jgi:uncharacterized RDD family membrane protein YckC
MATALRCDGCNELLWIDPDSAKEQFNCRRCGKPIDLPTPAFSEMQAVDSNHERIEPSQLPQEVFAPATVHASWTPKGKSIASLAKPADLFERFLAKCIDYFLQLVVPIGVALLLALTTSQLVENERTAMAVYTTTLLVLIIAIAVVQWILIANGGQSIGKRFMRIRLANRHNDKIPDFAQSVIIRLWLVNLINVVFPVFYLINVCLIFFEDRRCVHDIMAGTRVIRVVKPTRSKPKV